MGGPALVDGEERHEFDNFHPCSIEKDGVIYPSAEHFFQAHKSVDPAERRRIARASLEEVYMMGRRLQLRLDWEHVKLIVMLEANERKYAQNRSLRDALLATRGAMYFTPSAGFWGVVNLDSKAGENWNGHIHVAIRARLRGDDDEHQRQIARLHARCLTLGMQHESLVGETVRVEGLQSRPELNGQLGRVTAIDRAAGRIGVSVDGAKAVLIRLVNVRLAAYAVLHLRGRSAPELLTGSSAVPPPPPPPPPQPPPQTPPFDAPRPPTVALLYIDPQRGFTTGAWARHFGDVEPIRRTFASVQTLLRSGALSGVPLLTTRVPYPPPDCDVDPSVSLLATAPYVVKPTMDVTAHGDPFHRWMREQLSRGVKTLVVGGCTTTSCVRVSSQAIVRAYGPRLDVVVDLSLCAARAANYEKTAAEDADLLAIYGADLCRGRSAVDLAAWQMEQAGVRVVPSFEWRAAQVVEPVAEPRLPVELIDPMMGSSGGGGSGGEGAKAVEGAAEVEAATASAAQELDEPDEPEELDEEDGSSEAEFKLLTWNVLAPCYFRDSLGAESQLEGAASRRHMRILAAVLALAADCVCLQEYWFDAALDALYRRQLLGRYSLYTLQRTGQNCEGRSEDGVAIAIAKERYRVLLRRDVKFREHGIAQDRVALCVVVQPLTQPLSAPAITVVTTHLTFAHHVYDEQARQMQIAACVRAVDEALAAWRPHQSVPVILAGDLNGGGDDEVACALRRAGFARCFDGCHGRPVRTTHADHRGRAHAADHIWVRQPAGAGIVLSIRDVSLIPRATPDGAVLVRPVLDRCAMRKKEERLEQEDEEDRKAPAPIAFEEWCALSDHRPLVATFSHAFSVRTV